jgi:hypothetical protein
MSSRRPNVLRLMLWLAVLSLLPSVTAGAAELERTRAIAAAIVPGQWHELPQTRLQDVFPSRDGHPAWGIIGPRGVIEAWSGAAFDTKRSILVVTGGGHADYGGNEVYEFSLETLRWTRATEPSRLTARDENSLHFVVADGSEAPISTHTYDGLVYLPNVDRVFKFGGSAYRSGVAPDGHAYLYDVEARRWSRRAAAPRSVLEVATAYDTRTGEALVVHYTGLMAYDPVKDEWRDVARGDAHARPGTAEFGSLSGELVLVGGALGPVASRSLTPLGPLRRSPLSGDTSFAVGAPGIAFHPDANLFFIWNGDRTVWSLDPATWNVRLWPNREGPAPSHHDPDGKMRTRGIYGRWQYVPALEVFIGYVHSADNVWLYRPASRNVILNKQE